MRRLICAIPLFLCLLPVYLGNSAPLQLSDTARVSLLLKLSSDSCDNAPYHAIETANQALTLANKNNSDKHKALAYLALGNAYYCNGNISKAAEELNNGLIIANHCSDEEIIALIKVSLAKIYIDLAKYEEAGGFLFSALRSFDHLDQKKNIAIACNNIGVMYYSRNNFITAIKYYEKALQNYKIIGDSSGVAKVYNNMGVIYFYNKKYEKALENYENAKNIYFRLHNLTNCAAIANNIGLIYKEQGKYNLAFKYYNEALKQYKKLKIESQVAAVELNVAGVLLAKKDANQALERALKSFGLAEKQGNLETKKNAAEMLSLIYEFKEDKAQALFYLRIFSDLNKELSKSENIQSINELEAKYQNEKNLREIELLNREKNLRETELQQKQTMLQHQRLKTWTFILGFVVALALAFSIFRTGRANMARNAILEERQRELASSLAYAKRIQTAILPSQFFLKRNFPDYFILYKPKEVVSGDFYWINKYGKELMLGVVDCTGHGVPGAFMSVLGITYLNEIVNMHEGVKANEILNLLRENVITSLHQNEKFYISRDGMDIALCIINTKTLEMQFASSVLKAYVLRPTNDKYQVIELAGDKFPIGMSDQNLISFHNHIFQLERGDSLYMMTDGIIHQFGGADGKKYKKKKLLTLLTEIAHLNMKEQKRAIHESVNEWKGDLEQIDDMLMMGIKF
jgi:serine phosphatase RsbU (regulator of sigma subunit)